MERNLADGDPGLPDSGSSKHQGPDQACKEQDVKEQCHSQEGMGVPETHLSIQAIRSFTEAHLEDSISTVASRVDRFQIMVCHKKQALTEEHPK